MTVLNLQYNTSGNYAVSWCAYHNAWELIAPAFIIVGVNLASAEHNNGNKWGSNIRVPNVTIPQGATIISAYLEVTGYGAHSLNNVNTRITGKLTPISGVWGTLAEYQAARGTEVGGANDNGRTTAQVTWNSVTAFAANIKYQSPDITSVIQEIVNQAGWSSGSELVLFWDDHRGDSTQVNWTRRIAYSGWVVDGDKCPLLHIEYVAAVSVQTDAATAVTTTGATLNGTLVADGGAAQNCDFEYGLTSSYGSTTSPTESRTTGQTFAKAITGLTPATLYYFRARATVGASTVYGSPLTFTTLGSAYPTSPHIRVGSLVHRVSPGNYNLEMILGGLTSQYSLPVLLKRPIPALPGEEPVTPTPAPTPVPTDPYSIYTQYAFVVWLSQHTASQIAAFFGHSKPAGGWDYNEWVHLMYSGTGGGGLYGPAY